MSKTLLVLGAGIYQLPAIETAKRLGYRVLTTDNVPDNPGHRVADQSFGFDITDAEGVSAIGERQQISGVIAPCTDAGVVSAAIIADRLRLPGPPVHAATVLTQKYRFREFLDKCGYPSPRCVSVRGDEVPVEIFEGGRWLLKPNRSSGSKGVRVISTPKEFSANLAETRRFSLDGSAILEEHIEGTQHTCEGLLRSGHVALALVTDRDTAPHPYTATTGHRAPSRLPEETQNAALRAIEEILGRLGVRSGPFDCDFVARSGEIVLLEMTPRLGGNSLSKLFKATLNFDLVAYAAAHACGDPYTIPASCKPLAMSVQILGADRAGTLVWNTAEVCELLREPWVESLSFDAPFGAFVERFTNGRQRVGEAMLSGSDRRELDAHILQFKKRLSLGATPSGSSISAVSSALS
jgi:biotin carboxylase